MTPTATTPRRAFARREPEWANAASAASQAHGVRARRLRAQHGGMTPTATTPRRAFVRREPEWANAASAASQAHGVRARRLGAQNGGARRLRAQP